jgi:hypothetical protein
VGQRKHEDVDFLSRAFLKSSSSSRSQADRGFSGQGCSSPSRARLLNSVEWSLFCSSMGIGKGQDVNTMALTSLPWMRNIGGGIRLRIESFRGLWLGCFLSGRW